MYLIGVTKLINLAPVDMKTRLGYLLWFLTICAVGFLAYALINFGGSLRHSADTTQNSINNAMDELDHTVKQFNDKIDRLPDIARESANKATGGAIDAANPLRNAAEEAKRDGKKVEKAAQHLKSETNNLLKHAGISGRL